MRRRLKNLQPTHPRLWTPFLEDRLPVVAPTDGGDRHAQVEKGDLKTSSSWSVTWQGDADLVELLAKLAVYNEALRAWRCLAGGDWQLDGKRPRVFLAAKCAFPRNGGGRLLWKRHS